MCFIDPDLPLFFFDPDKLVPIKKITIRLLCYKFSPFFNIMITYSMAFYLVRIRNGKGKNEYRDGTMNCILYCRIHFPGYFQRPYFCKEYIGHRPKPLVMCRNLLYPQIIVHGGIRPASALSAKCFLIWESPRMSLKSICQR